LKDDLRYILGGTALGAALGALVGWLYARQRQTAGQGAPGRRRGMDSQRVMRLVWSLIGLVRQVLELA